MPEAKLSDRMRDANVLLGRENYDPLQVLEWATEVAALEAELQVVRAMLDTAYHLRFVDDTSTHEEQMEFWTDVEEKIRDE